MSAITVINKVIESKLFDKDAIFVPKKGAKIKYIEKEQVLIGHTFSKEFVTFLEKWNGIDLDIIRMCGVGNIKEGIDRIFDIQMDIDHDPKLIVIGSDPAGFLYAEDESGAIYSFDTDGGDIAKIATDFDDLIERLVFGNDADKFAEEEWKQEIIRAGLLTRTINGDQTV